MKDTSLSDGPYLEHMRECMQRGIEYTESDRNLIESPSAGCRAAAGRSAFQRRTEGRPA
jgi:hypothetical protein